MKNRKIEGKPAQPETDKSLSLRSYQESIFMSAAGTLILHWSRQIGKSHVLAHWAVHRMVDKLADHPSWLITVLSNSRDNGAEFCRKAAEASRFYNASCETTDESPNVLFENMRMEIRITYRTGGRIHVGRIKVLAANPRTARGFSGDLILDEFAFHENSHAIWEAAEPILAANKEFLCRIASTGNGRHNLFYRMASGPGANDGTVFQSPAGFSVSRLTRSEAYKLGVEVFDANTRASITPEQARLKALDKRAYDQNYECQFNDENTCLLTHELIQVAERAGAGAGDRLQLSIPIDEQVWSARSLARMASAEGQLSLGGDIGRHRDLTVFAVLEKVGQSKRLVALLRLAGMRLPEQQRQLEPVIAMPRFNRACIDMTGIGLGLVEYAQERWGHNKIQGVNFATTEPINDRIRSEGRAAETARVTEIMATDLLAAFEDRSFRIEVELDADAREDLRKPEKVTSPGGRVSIAATRTEAGHADHFWALALAVRAAQVAAYVPNIRHFIPPSGRIARAIAMRRDPYCY
jgi:phage FluMu gp28-like protein